jgi:uncharacterized membrane protein SpoIIM required for sporulation
MLKKYLLVSFPQLIRSERNLFLLALILFVSCLLLSFIVVQFDNRPVFLLYGEFQLAELSRSYHPDYNSLMRYQDRHPWQDGLFYFLNNSLVGIQLLLAGLLLGGGTLVLLVYGAISLGTLMGYIYARGYGEALWPAIVGHSSLELLATLLSATAGLYLGRWLLSCIRARRLQAPLSILRRIGDFMLPALILYALAALVEANWSHHPLISDQARYLFGIGLWSLWLAYFSFIAKTKPADKLL